METRWDGSQYPSSDADDAVLREVTDPKADTKLTFAYHRTIADLVIDFLAGGPLCESGDSDPENWQTLENAMVRNAGLEIKALSAALTVESGGCSDEPDELTHGEAVCLLRSLSRRLEAGAELAKRMRRARWGHPSFGGGENWEAKQKAEKSECQAEAAKPQAAE